MQAIMRTMIKYNEWPCVARADASAASRVQVDAEPVQPVTGSGKSPRSPIGRAA